MQEQTKSPYHEPGHKDVQAEKALAIHKGI